MAHDLEHEKEHEQERAKEAQIVKYLHERVQFDLPPPLLRTETRRALTELVQRNRERGVSDEVLKGKEKELVEGAGGLAAHRLKTNFILGRIAEREKIEVSREDVGRGDSAGGSALQCFSGKNAKRAGGARAAGRAGGTDSAG